MHTPINYVSATLVLVFLLVLFSHRLRHSNTWTATVTPLASIIGSGFLISGPFLYLAVGSWAIWVMLLIVSFAFLIGSVLRFNIDHLESLLDDHSSQFVKMEHLSRFFLWVAYTISICYYLKLLSAFTFMHSQLDPIFENILTTSLLLFIALFGLIKGLDTLEVIEKYAVNFKLAIIFTLITMALYFNGSLFWNNEWILQANGHMDIPSFREVLGFLIIIQGFEISRFMASKYSPQKRKKTMLLAQIISGGVYVAFLALTVILYQKLGSDVDETTIIELCGEIAPILSPFLLLAAIASQFSASIADTLGGGGIIHERFKKITLKKSYVIITGFAIHLTWITNIYEIVVYASKGFAVYYAIETLIALKIIVKQKKWGYRIGVFSIVLLILLTVIVFGKPIDSSGA